MTILEAMRDPALFGSWFRDLGSVSGPEGEERAVPESSPEGREPFVADV